MLLHIVKHLALSVTEHKKLVYLFARFVSSLLFCPLRQKQRREKINGHTALCIGPPFPLTRKCTPSYLCIACTKHRLEATARTGRRHRLAPPADGTTGPDLPMAGNCMLPKAERSARTILLRTFGFPISDPTGKIFKPAAGAPCPPPVKHSQQSRCTLDREKSKKFQSFSVSLGMKRLCRFYAQASTA